MIGVSVNMWSEETYIVVSKDFRYKVSRIICTGEFQIID